ncbi:hypothetical protein [Salinigranum halophilum]|jgi:hypothetical protein|nr:hypothetical protein [Salinigranum halophilum]
MLSQERQTYHVVCHDCAFESLTQTNAEARRLSQAHATEADHQTRYARIQ